MAHTPMEKLVAYFSQQLKLQKNGEIKYNPHEVWEDAIGVCSNLLDPPPLSNEDSRTPEVKGYSRDEVERMASNEGIKYCNKNHLGAAAYSKLHSCFVAGAMYGVSLPTPSTDKL